MPSIYDCFTPISELLIQEPSYFRQECSYVSNIKPQTNFSQKSPVTILLEGSRRIYDTLPIYTTISERHSEGNIPWFLISCSLMGVKTQGEAKTKKSAKHIAAIAMLHAIVDKGYSKEFGLPSNSDEDAHKAIDSLVDFKGEENDENSYNANQNYVGKLQELCQKNKMAMPIFESVESGPHHSKTFVTTCKIVHQEVIGSAKNKKGSKNNAAFKMCCLLEKGLTDINSDCDLNEVEDRDENFCDPLSSSEVTDTVKTLEEILSDTNRFGKPTTDYRILSQHCSFGLVQCLLKLSYCRPGETINTLIFPGQDSTEEQARQAAAKIAIMHLNTL